MREKSNFGPMAIILVCAVAVGLLVGWLAVKGPKTETVTPPETVSTTPPSNSIVVATETNAPVVETNTPEEIAEPQPPVESDEVTAENWNDKLTDLLASDKIDEDEKADKLADMIPKLPEAAQVELAEHLVNLVADENYQLKAAKILVSETIPASVSGVLLNDLMNRNDGLRLPLTLQIAKNQNHPLHAEALESLEMTLTEEFGDDWGKWEKAVEDSLKEQGLWEEPTANPQP